MSPGGATKLHSPLNTQEAGRSRQQSYVTLMTTATITQTHKHTVTHTQSPSMLQVIKIKYHEHPSKCTN